MGFAQDVGDALGEGAPGDGGQQRRLIELAGVVAGAPVVGMAQQIVAAARPGLQVERFGEHPEAQDLLHIDLAGNMIEFRHSLGPAVQPILSHHASDLGADARFDRRHDFRNTVVVVERGDVFVEIAGTGRADAERMHLRARQTVEIVELHGRERLA